MKRVVYFFPFSPIPARSGAARRCVEMLTGLRELGCRTDFLFVESAGLPADAAKEFLRREGLAERVHAFKPGWFDYRCGSLLAKLGGIASPPYNSPLARLWFRRRLGEASPDALLMSYAFCDCLVPRSNRLVKAIDSVDLCSLYAIYSQMVEANLPPFPVNPSAVPDAFLREDFYERLDLRPSLAEFAVYERYHHTLAISWKESTILRAGTRKTRVSYLPMTHEPVALANAHDGPAIFVMRAHPFNLQGYCYLARRVLPLVTRSIPDFCLRVVGDGCDCVQPTDGVDLAGFVPDLSEAYRVSRFAIVPVFGGTGQQVKLVEAMAHGVPVIAIRQAAESSPLIEHGVNGLIAANAEEFAEHILRLWQDPPLCRQMGQAARETVARHFGRDQLVRGLAEVLA